MKLSSKEKWLAKSICNKAKGLLTFDIVETLRGEVADAWKKRCDEEFGPTYNATSHRRDYRCSGRVISIPMPENCPEENATCETVRTVRVFIVDPVQVWLDEKDVAWAVRYMFVQHQLEGFPLMPDGDAGPGE